MEKDREVGEARSEDEPGDRRPPLVLVRLIDEGLLSFELVDSFSLLLLPLVSLSSIVSSLKLPNREAKPEPPNVVVVVAGLLVVLVSGGAAELGEAERGREAAASSPLRFPMTD